MHQMLWTNESLFRAAWMMSVPTTTEPFLAPDAKPHGRDSLVKQYAKACGCPSPRDVVEAEDCLRLVDTRTMQNNSESWAGSMTSLGGFVRSNVFDTIRDGDFPEIPLAFSICRDEGTAAAFGFKSNDTETTSFSIYSMCRVTDRQAYD